MANKPCFGIYRCPHCHQLTPAFWNGNIQWPCRNCRLMFTVKRQKLTHVRPYKGNLPEDDSRVDETS